MGGELFSIYYVANSRRPSDLTLLNECLPNTRAKRHGGEQRVFHRAGGGLASRSRIGLTPRATSSRHLVIALQPHA